MVVVATSMARNTRCRNTRGMDVSSPFSKMRGRMSMCDETCAASEDSCLFANGEGGDVRKDVPLLLVKLWTLNRPPPHQPHREDASDCLTTSDIDCVGLGANSRAIDPSVAAGALHEDETGWIAQEAVCNAYHSATATNWNGSCALSRARARLGDDSILTASLGGSNTGEEQYRDDITYQGHSDNLRMCRCQLWSTTPTRLSACGVGK